MEHIASAARPASRAILPITSRARPITDRKKLPDIFKKSIDQDVIDRVVLAWTGVGEDRGEPHLRRALDAKERLAMELRATELRNALAPAPVESAEMLRNAIGAMLGAFPMMQRHDAESAQVIAAGYFHSVREEPHWAVIEACRRVREGQAGLSLSYCPTEPEFASVVRQCCYPYVVQLRHATAVLKAEPPRSMTPEEQDAVAAKANAYLERREHDPIEQAARKRRLEFLGMIGSRERENRIQEYLDAGLEPPEDRGFGVVSLPFMLQQGFSIIENRGRRELVR